MIKKKNHLDKKYSLRVHFPPIVHRIFYPALIQPLQMKISCNLPLKSLGNLGISMRGCEQ